MKKFPFVFFLFAFCFSFHGTYDEKIDEKLTEITSFAFYEDSKYHLDGSVKKRDFDASAGNMAILMCTNRRWEALDEEEACACLNRADGCAVDCEQAFRFSGRALAWDARADIDVKWRAHKTDLYHLAFLNCLTGDKEVELDLEWGFHAPLFGLASLLDRLFGWRPSWESELGWDAQPIMIILAAFFALWCGLFWGFCANWVLRFRGRRANKLHIFVLLVVVSKLFALAVSGGFWVLLSMTGRVSLYAELVVLFAVFQWEGMAVGLAWLVARGWGILPHRGSGGAFLRFMSPLTLVDVPVLVLIMLAIYLLQLIAILAWRWAWLGVAAVYLLLAVVFFVLATVTRYRIAALGAGKTGRPRICCVPIPGAGFGGGSFEELNAESGGGGDDDKTADVEVDHTSGENDGERAPGASYSVENVRSKMKAVTVFQWISVVMFAMLAVTVAVGMLAGSHLDWVRTLWFESLDFFFGFTAALVFRRKGQARRSAIDDVVFESVEERKKDAEESDLVDMEEFDSFGYFH